jgi:protease-4
VARHRLDLKQEIIMFARRPVLCVLIALSGLLMLLPPAHGAAAKAGKPVIAVFDLNGELAEQPADDQLALFSPPPPSLRDVVRRMKAAGDDPNVKAVVILADGASFGFAQAQELRQAIQRLQTSGKDVYAHSDSMMMGGYVLLCGATRLSVSPTGDIWVTGFYGDAPYLRGLLDKIGVQPDFIHCGAYKSASEIFMRDGPSPEADAMQNWLFDSEFDSAVQMIADGRKVSADKAHSWIDEGPYTAEKAKAAGMIDAVEQRADFEATLKDKFGKDITFDKRYGQPKQPELDLSNPFAVLKTFGELMGGQKSSVDQKPAIGVVYVTGMILLGKSDDSLFGDQAATSTDIAKALDDAARDDSVKAVVLRIDSPGGSATASEVILAATERLKAKKPLVVSMGDVAGSGGYYVSCAADTVFADDATITGSIGVVGGKFATTAMWNKIGITFKSYQRGKNAALLSSDAIFTDSERQRMQAWMDEVYGVFKGHVTTIRGSKLKKPIDDLAGGRVYTGKQAIDLGLVDKIGTLEDAIEFAADKVSLKDYDVRTVPEPKNILQKLIEQSSGGDDDPSRLSVGGMTRAATPPTSLLKLAAPYLAGLDPHRVKQIEAALRQLQLMQSEGVIVVMPVQAVMGN